MSGFKFKGKKDTKGEIVYQTVEQNKIKQKREIVTISSSSSSSSSSSFSSSFSFKIPRPKNDLNFLEGK